MDLEEVSVRSILLDSDISFFGKELLKKSFRNFLDIEEWSSYGNRPMWKQIEEGYFESTNHRNNSKSGMQTNLGKVKELSFDWIVHSESGFDFFNIYVNEKRVLSKSSASGAFYKDFNGKEDIILAVEYTKDRSVSVEGDRAWIKNIKIKY